MWLVSAEEEQVLKKLLQANYDTTISMNLTTRRNLLEALLRFYSSHIDNFGEIRSVQVLKDFFD